MGKKNFLPIFICQNMTFPHFPMKERKGILRLY
jgi:hypothetical protein